VTPLRTTLQFLTAVFVLAGGALLAWRPGPVSAESASGEVPAAATFTPLARPDERHAESIVNANIFHASRQAPASRYVPPDQQGEAGMVAMEDSTMMMDGDDAGDGEAVPALFGTVIGPDGDRALLRLDYSRSEPSLYAVGERAGGYRVVRISERQVELAGPGGRVTLRMKSEESRP